MKIRIGWITWLHNYRKREFSVIFSKCPQKLFQVGLECGAGDGFQSTLLSNYVSKLISTDINPDRLKMGSNKNIEYCICDAEEVNKKFQEKQFDLVFSSNLLEHLPNPKVALEGMREVMKDNGIAIHVIPSPFWKLCDILFFVPNRIVGALEKLGENKELKERLERIEQKIKAE